MNKVLLYGRVSQKSELRKTNNDISVINITVATGYGEKVTFVPVVIWSKQAEMINNYVDKGDRIVVEGHVSSSKNTRNDITSVEYKITADMITLVETKKEKTNDNFEDDIPEEKIEYLETTDTDLPF